MSKHDPKAVPYLATAESDGVHCAVCGLWFPDYREVQPHWVERMREEGIDPLRDEGEGAGATHIDPANGSDEQGDGSKERPYKTYAPVAVAAAARGLKCCSECGALPGFLHANSCARTGLWTGL